jgi:Rps23 Pro-64 3,4-dihydroxylase Tpa1-like proline 4-hydroxylase
MWQLGPAWHDEAALARAWRTARPFPHLVIDALIGPAALADLMAIVDEEPVDGYQGDLFAFDATAPEPRTAELRALREALAAALAPRLTRITGRAVTRADLRAYAYGPGHHLLPHTDHRDGLGRAIAFAYYLPSPEPPAGGELELFACRLDGGELTDFASARLIEPVPDRLVLFEVGDVSLHQVREVLAGRRLSLAGWFYP